MPSLLVCVLYPLVFRFIFIQLLSQYVPSLTSVFVLVSIRSMYPSMKQASQTSMTIPSQTSLPLLDLIKNATSA